MNGLILLLTLQSQRGAEEKRTAAMIDFQNCKEAETSNAARLHSWVLFPSVVSTINTFRHPHLIHPAFIWSSAGSTHAAWGPGHIPFISSSNSSSSTWPSPVSCETQSLQGVWTEVSYQSCWDMTKGVGVWPRSSVWTPLHSLTEIHVTGLFMASWPGSRENRISTVNLLLAAQHNRTQQR